MPELAVIAQQALDKIEQMHLRRTLKPVRREDGIHLSKGGKSLISFSCNNYLGLTHHPAIRAAAQKALEEYGTGSGASRLVTGNFVLYRDLEEKLAALKHTDGALVFGSGYLANMGVIPALMQSEDLILMDELVHASLIDGIRFSGAKWMRFKHNDMKDLERLLHRHRNRHRHCLIVTDGVFSMDGDIAPLDTISELAKQYDGWVMTDDAHGLGVLADGQGSRALFSDTTKIDLQMGTLSKAAGGYGGYVCAAHSVIEYLQNTARTLIYSTALPPVVIAIGIAALDVMMNDKELCALPLRKATLFTDTLGLPKPQSPIVPLILGEAEATMRASLVLEQRGYLVAAIRPPTVPEGTSRLRFAFSALHEDKDILALAELVREKGWAS